MQRFCALTILSRGREKEGGSGGRAERKGREEGKKEKRVLPRYRRFLRGRGMEVRPFIISRHAPASQQYRPLTISGSHTTPSTATLRPRSNYRENADRGPLSCFQLLSLSFADTDLSGKRTPAFLSGISHFETHRPLLNVPDKYFLYEISLPEMFGKQRGASLFVSVPRPNPVT